MTLTPERVAAAVAILRPIILSHGIVTADPVEFLVANTALHSGTDGPVLFERAQKRVHLSTEDLNNLTIECAVALVAAGLIHSATDAKILDQLRLELRSLISRSGNVPPIYTIPGGVDWKVAWDAYSTTYISTE